LSSNCHRLIASGKADIDFMVTHHFPFENPRGLRLSLPATDGVVKAMITLE
jgi:threonine dehydrogenase-like Zn-dependent dehydrogenase